jgi:hypothetical protein
MYPKIGKNKVLRWLICIGLVLFYIWFNGFCLANFQLKILDLSIMKISNKILIQFSTTLILSLLIVFFFTLHPKGILYFCAYMIVVTLLYTIYFFLYKFFKIVSENMSETYSTAIFNFTTNPFLLIAFLMGWTLKDTKGVKNL